MAFEGLTDKLLGVFKRLGAKGKLVEADVKTAMREVRLALLEADVNYKIAKNFTDKVAERAIGEDVMESLTPGQMVIKIVNEELICLMGGADSRINKASHPPCVIMICGLQGSGKTTHAVKLANMLKKKGHRPLLAACDVYRPAAIEQLKILADKIDIPVFERGTSDPIVTSEQAVLHAKDHGNDFVIIDTAGRLHIDENLMEELTEIKSRVSPSEILLAIDAMMGQDAVNVAEAFNSKLEISGVILTKLDGDTRGGAALSVKAATGKPIKFIGTGEKIEDIEAFHPDRMASRILGMGDVLTLIEEAESKLDLKNAEKMAQKLNNNDFNLQDFAEQIVQIKRLGPLKSVLGKFPGIGSKINDMDFDDKILDRNLAMIQSMTSAEKIKPSIINSSRKTRIAKGSGTDVSDVNKLLRGFEQIQKAMKHFNGMKKKKFPLIGFRK